MGYQYIGSSANFLNRLGDHIDQFTGSRLPFYLHEWTITNGGLSHLFWGIIYSTPNYLVDFIKTHPTHILSLGELDILKAMPQWIPRILEQSILDNTQLFFNQAKTVFFQYNTFVPESLNIFDFLTIALK